MPDFDTILQAKKALQHGRKSNRYPWLLCKSNDDLALQADILRVVSRVEIL